MRQGVREADAIIRFQLLDPRTQVKSLADGNPAGPILKSSSFRSIPHQRLAKLLQNNQADASLQTRQEVASWHYSLENTHLTLTSSEFPFWNYAEKSCLLQNVLHQATRDKPHGNGICWEDPALTPCSGDRQLPRRSELFLTHQRIAQQRN